MAPRRLSAASGGRLQQPEVTRSTKRADAFYVSPEWKAFRNALIKSRGWRCEHPRCQTPRGPWKQIYGHHIVEIADGGAKLDPVNVQLCCGVCHGRVTREAKAMRAGLIDIGGRGD